MSFTHDRLPHRMHRLGVKARGFGVFLSANPNMVQISWARLS